MREERWPRTVTMPLMTSMTSPAAARHGTDGESSGDGHCGEATDVDDTDEADDHGGPSANSGPGSVDDNDPDDSGVMAEDDVSSRSAGNGSHDD